MNNGNGRWQLAFWIITAICGIWLAMLTTNVVSNDRMRAEEDSKIKEKFEYGMTDVQKKFEEISIKLTRIETKIN